MRRILVVMVAVIVGAIATPARAQGATVCRFEAQLLASPGLSTTESSGTSASDGEAGTMECDGWVDGRQPTGPGTFGLDGRYGTSGPDSCTAGGEGDGLQSFTLPTSQGPLHIENRVTFMYDAVSEDGVITGRFHSQRLSGTFEMVPVKGACSGSPVTRMVIRGAGELRSGWSPRGENCGGSAASV